MKKQRVELTNYNNVQMYTYKNKRKNYINIAARVILFIWTNVISKFDIRVSTISKHDSLTIPTCVINYNYTYTYRGACILV